jgi:hypothetical protein
LGGSILALIILESKREVRTAVHQLSVNGGLLKIEKPLDEQIKVTLMFHIGATTIRTKAKMLFPMWATNGWLQPFQFIDFPEEDKQKLDSELGTLFPKPATRVGVASVTPTMPPPAPVVEAAPEVAQEVASDEASVEEVASEQSISEPGTTAEVSGKDSGPFEAVAGSDVATMGMTEAQTGESQSDSHTLASLAVSTGVEDTESKDAPGTEPTGTAQLPVVTDSCAENATAASAE